MKVTLSIKTLFSRFSNVKVGKFVDDEDAKAINDIAKALDKVGIQLIDGQNKWRDVGVVIGEVADKWDTLNDREKNAISTSVAGVRQAEMWRALMNNWDRAQELIKVSIESTGSAAEKMQTYMGGLEAKVNAFKTAWGQLIYNQDTVKFFASIVDGGTKLLGVLQQVVSNGLVQFIAKIVAAEAAFLGFARAMKLIEASKLVKGIKDLIKQFTTLAVAASTTGTTVAASAATGSAAVVAAEATVTASTITLSGAISALTTVMLTNPLFLGAVAVAGIVAVVSAIDAFTVSTEEAHQKMVELTDEFKATQSEMESIDGRLEEIQKQMKEINSSGEITITDEATLETLRKETEELQRQLDILKDKAEIQSRDVINAGRDFYNKNIEPNPFDLSAIEKAKENIQELFQGGFIKDYKNNINEIIAAIELFTNALDNNIGQQDIAEQGLQEANQALVDYKQRISDTIAALEILPNPTKENTELLDALREQLDQIRLKLDGAEYKLELFNNALTSLEVDGTIEKLRELNEVGMLDEAAIENIEAFKDVMERTGMSASDILAELKDRFTEATEAEEELVDKTEDLETQVKDLTDILDGFANATSTVKDIQQELAETGQLSVDSLKQIADLYPEMADALYAYVSGLMTEEEVMARLSELYAQDRENYATAIRDKMGDSEQFFNSLLAANEGLIQRFNEVYQIDLTNCKTYNEAKLLIDQKAKAILLKLNYDFEGELIRMYGEESKEYKEFQDAKKRGDAELLGWLAEHWAEYFGTTSDGIKNLVDAALEGAGAAGKGFESFNKILGELGKSIDRGRVEASLNALQGDIQRLSGAAAELNTISLAPISMEFDSLSSSIGNTTSAAKQAENAMKSLVDSVVKMLKQNANNRKAALKDRIADAKKAYDAAKNALKKEYDARKNALKKENDQRKRALEDQKKARDRALEDQYKAMKRAWEDEYKARKDAIDKNYDTLKDSIEKEKKAVVDGIQEQIDAYEKLIDAKITALDRESDEHDYQAEIAEKLKDISALQERITELQNDVSPEGTKKRLQLEKELAEKTNSLTEFQYDREMELRKQALQDELDRYKEEMEAKKEAAEESFDNQLDIINKEKEAELAALEAIKEAKERYLQDWKESRDRDLDDWYTNQKRSLDDWYDYEQESLQSWYNDRQAALQADYDSKVAGYNKQIAALDDYLSKEGALRKEAMDKILNDGELTLEQLLAWNREFGDGCDQTIKYVALIY